MHCSVVNKHPNQTKNDNFFNCPDFICISRQGDRETERECEKERQIEREREERERERERKRTLS